MNIADAKKQVKDTVEAYLAKDDVGMPLIDPVHQRPLFLIGAPGIGKTAIMEQVAHDLGIGLVSYSMTHHTRQSALGLPIIEHHDFEGFEYDASEYTMSEIIASVYDYMKETGLSQGILFLDEVNCVSETLYPSMLQFLQFKTFGRHHVPADWVVVCAGNPPEYNRLVHELDIVTLDRLRKIEVEPDYDAWKAYAQESDVHPAVLTFLEVKKDCFYSVEAKPGARSFVTARGWSDLSETIALFEHMDKTVDLNLVTQFLQNDDIAEQFSVYYDLFNKYRSDYQIDKILAGDTPDDVIERAKAAPFDECIALLGLLLDALGDQMSSALQAEQTLVLVRDELLKAKEPLLEGESIRQTVGFDVAEWADKLASDTEAGTKLAADVRVERHAIALLKSICAQCELESALEGDEAFQVAKRCFDDEVAKLDPMIDGAEEQLAHVFEFIENAFGDEREMLVLTAELTARGATSKFINRFGSASYYAHNEGLMVDHHQQDLLARIDELGLQDEKTADAAKSGGAAKADTIVSADEAPSSSSTTDGNVQSGADADESSGDAAATATSPNDEEGYEDLSFEGDVALGDANSVSDPDGLREVGKPGSMHGVQASASTLEIDIDDLRAYYAGAQFEYGLPSLCKMTLPADLEGKTVLDIGCRRGKGVFKLSSRVGASGHVIGIDWVEAYIEEAAKKMDRAWHDSGLPQNNMEVHVGYPEALYAVDIADSSVDVVFINSVSNLVFDTEAAYSEMLRVLRRGGYVVNETVLADRARDERVISEARSIGNSVQSAPDKRTFEDMLAHVGFRSVSYSNSEPVTPDEGALPQIPADLVETDEDVRYTALVATISK